VGITVAEASLVAGTFLAAGVEFVEALTIVLAMGVARSWRAALWGAGAAALALAAVTVVVGGAIGGVTSRATLQLVVGVLLLVFGLQWLRKAILRAAGLKALHDEDEAFAAERRAAREADAVDRLGLDWYAFVVSFKGVLLEGLEVVFIVVTLGSSARNVPLAAAAATAAALLVVAAGAVVHRPLARVPENTLKFAVGIVLSTYGLFWTVEGLGAVTPAGTSLSWPGGDAAALVLFVAWLALARALVRLLRRRTPAEVPAS
jgi:uncharacterized membrane protein